MLERRWRELNGYNFSERLRKILAMARAESSRRHHTSVDTEHLLLALIDEGEGVAAMVLQNLGIDMAAMTTRIESARTAGDAGRPKSLDLPYSGSTKSVLELAMLERRDHRHLYVGSEHLLIALLREGNVAAHWSTFLAHGRTESQHSSYAAKIARQTR